MVHLDALRPLHAGAGAFALPFFVCHRVGVVQIAESQGLVGKLRNNCLSLSPVTKTGAYGSRYELDEIIVPNFG